jgi:hypothetical protein
MGNVTDADPPASGISTTIYTEQGRSVCKHLDDLFDLPEFEGVDQQILGESPF